VCIESSILDQSRCVAVELLTLVMIRTGGRQVLGEAEKTSGR
jgi:hypothetical protein